MDNDHELPIVDENDLPIVEQSCQKFVLGINHQLNQSSALILSGIDFLLGERSYGFVNEDQKQAILALRKEALYVRAISMRCYDWLDKQK